MTDDNTEPEHYFYDSGGHLWVDVTAVRENGGLEVIPVETDKVGEVILPVTQFQVGKQHPSLQAVLTVDADDNLRDAYGRM